MNRPSLIIVALASALAVAAPPQGKAKPKLVVVVVVDQLRRSELDRLGPHFTGGFARLLSTGAVLDGHYGQQNTYTGPGHALILSGSYGYLNGIIQNKWYNRERGRSEGMLFDPDAKPIGGESDPASNPDNDTSPRNFNGSTVGDELRLASGMGSKSVSVALKERGALLLGGRLGQAWFFGEKTGQMITSTYYLDTLPEWVAKFNAQKLAEASFGKSWERALPVGAYTISGPDDSPFEGDIVGLKRTFPHPLTGGGDKPGPKFYEAFMTSPMGIDYEFAFARAAVEADKLGGRGVTDLLAISVSPTDYIGHTFGVYSQETEDALVRTDRALGAFLTWLDGRLGKDGYVVVLTADHGASMPPEQAKKLGLGGARHHPGGLGAGRRRGAARRGGDRQGDAARDPRRGRPVVAPRARVDARVRRVGVGRQVRARRVQGAAAGGAGADGGPGGDHLGSARRRGDRQRPHSRAHAGHRR